MDRKRIEAFQTVASKSHNVLTFVLIALILLASRIWYLCIYDNQNKSAESRRGRYRQEIISADRGTIQDRFLHPVAINQIDYQLSIVWSDIVDAVPRKIIDQTGNSKGRRFLRKEYIKALSTMISKIVLSLSSKRIEDLIYSYAIYSHAIPVTLKNGLTEKEYAQLAAKAPFWPGLRLEIGTKRFYPYEKSLCHLIGYTAAIQKEEYDSVLALRARLKRAITYYETGGDGIEEELEKEPLYSLPYHILKKKLSVVERKLYSLKDSVGRTGIESSFESALRGLSGKKAYQTNARGNFLRETDGSRASSPGKRISLTVSLELQKKCEELLIQSESDRAQWLLSETKRRKEGAMNPFVRGGSIIALDATNGDVLALASTPRYNLNDFSAQNSSFIPETVQERLISKQRRQKRDTWLQNKTWIGLLWDGIIPLEREIWNKKKGEIEEIQEPFTWKKLLSISFPENASIHKRLLLPRTVHELIQIQRNFFEIKRELNITSHELAKMIVEKTAALNNFQQSIQELYELETAQEILAFIDFSRLLIRYEEVDPNLETFTKQISVSGFRSLSQVILQSKELLKELFHALYQEGPFQEWRKEHEINFLKEKREIEKKEKKINQPYILYLDKECTEQFTKWWKEHSDRICILWTTLLSSKIEPQEISHEWELALLIRLKRWYLQQKKSQSTSSPAFFSHITKRIAKTSLFSEYFSQFSHQNRIAILQMVTPFVELSKYPLEGDYSSIRRFGKPKTLQDILQTIKSMSAPNIQSLGYMLTNPPGSVFKLITASALLRNEEAKSGEVNPYFFRFEDRFFRIGEKPYVGISSKGEAIPQIYKGGRIPKSLTSSIGLVDLLRAIEYSSNPYFSLAASQCLPSPTLLKEEAERFGFGEKTGIAIPGEARGAVPQDLLTNKTALYTTAIGQHTLLSTPLQIATMLTAYSSKGTLFVPRIVSNLIGTTPKINDEEEKLYKTMLQKIGIINPIWIASRKEQQKPRIWVLPNEIKKTIDISSPHRNLIFQGMQRVVAKIARDTVSLQKVKQEHPDLYRAFQNQKEKMLAKTTTAESYERLGFPYGNTPFMYSHTGIGALFTKQPLPLQNNSLEIDPDIVVVVSLQYGSYGKEAATIAAKVVEEWRRISQKKQESIEPQ